LDYLERTRLVLTKLNYHFLLHTEFSKTMDEDDDEEVEYERENFKIGQYQFAVTTVSYMPITKLMQLRENEQEISGRKLWCGSLIVMDYLVSQPSIISSASVLELGAGTGVLGMLCKRLGASKVYLTDYDDESLNHMRSDCCHNGIQCEVRELNWFSPNFEWIDEIFVLNSAEDVMIIAGDVLYKRDLLEPFFSVVSKLLSKRSGSFLILGHVPRAGIEHKDVLRYCDAFQLIAGEIPADLWKNDCSIEYSPVEELEAAKLYHIMLRL